MIAHVLNTSTGRSWSSECNNPAPGALRGTKFSPPADRDWQGGFAAKLQAKDLRLALQAADQVGLPTPMATLASRIYDNLESADEVSLRFNGQLWHGTCFPLRLTPSSSCGP